MTPPESSSPTAVRRLVMTVAFGGGLLGLISSLLFALSLGTSPSQLILPDLGSVPPDRLGVFRWAALTDMLGYYLATVPVALYLRQRLAGRQPYLADVAATGAVIYATIGATAAMVLAAGVPLGPGEAVLELWEQVVMAGMWQTLQGVPFGAFMLAVAQLLRGRRPGLAAASAIIGVAAWVTVVGRMAEIDWLAAPAIVAWVALYPAWMLWVGTIVVREGDV